MSGLFSDYEIIIVENGSLINLQDLTLPDVVRQNCYVVTLARVVPYDLAALAGLERANGDYALTFDTTLGDQLELIERMFGEAQKGFDIVVLRDKSSATKSLRRWLFFALLRRVYPNLNSRDRKEAMLSRRALNWIQRYRNRSIYLSEVLAASGYKIAPVMLTRAAPVRRRSSEHRDRLAWATLARATQLPLQAATLTSGLLILVILVFSINALLVRLFNVDILGRPETAEPGLTYLVIFIALGFLLTNISLYAVLRVISVIHEDVRREPYYIVEAFRRI
ncbi:hypothetical protein [Thermaurantiacus sp.]